MKRSRLKNIINKSKEVSNHIGAFDKFKKSLPIEIDNDYRLEAAWKAYGLPKDYKAALWEGLVQPIDETTFKLPSIGYNKETEEYEYLNKGRDNELVNKDLRVWDNDVIPFVQELKQGGYIKSFDEEKNCWIYTKNSQKRELPVEDKGEQVIEQFREGGKPKKVKSDLSYYDSETDTIYYSGEKRKDRKEAYKHEYVHSRPDEYSELFDYLKPYYENLDDNKISELGGNLEFVKRFNGDPNHFYNPEELVARMVAASYRTRNVPEYSEEFFENLRLNENKYGDNMRDLLHMYNNKNLSLMFKYFRKPVSGGFGGEISEQEQALWLLLGGKYKNGLVCTTKNCAEFSNLELRDSDYIVSGNAWNLKGPELLYNGYITQNYPTEYDLKKVEEYNAQAADNFLKNFDSNSLDKNSVYAVNMYYTGSHAQEEAYKNGRDKMTGTHTGYVAWNPDTNRWEVTHNIYGTIHVDPFTKILGRNRKYGITGIFSLRKNNLMNKLATILGFGEGGTIETFSEGGKPSKRSETVIIADVNHSGAPFINRLLREDTRSIQVPGEKLPSTHLLTWSTDNKGNGIVYPMVMEDENGNLKYYENDAYKRALETNNYVVLAPEEAKWFTENYKTYYPKFFKHFQDGGVIYYKQGGQLNVIPDGALHAHKNHMQLAKEGQITPKGVPVIDKEGVLQAEVEREEWTMTKELTDDVEAWYKEYYKEDTSLKRKDELAIKCGKRITEELLHNTDDRTNLISKLSEEEE